MDVDGNSFQENSGVQSPCQLPLLGTNKETKRPHTTASRKKREDEKQKTRRSSLTAWVATPGASSLAKRLDRTRKAPHIIKPPFALVFWEQYIYMYIYIYTYICVFSSSDRLHLKPTGKIEHSLKQMEAERAEIVRKRAERHRRYGHGFCDRHATSIQRGSGHDSQTTRTSSPVPAACFATVGPFSQTKLEQYEINGCDLVFKEPPSPHKKRRRWCLSWLPIQTTKQLDQKRGTHISRQVSVTITDHVSLAPVLLQSPDQVPQAGHQAPPNWLPKLMLTQD